ncbi:MAG: translesion DNA synthesis-associated protein ImuA [Chromatiaceae bacterium]
MGLEQLLNGRRDLWRGRAVSAAIPVGISTGFAALDALLPWRGWPPGALSEILNDSPGRALALLKPTLARLSSEARWLLFIDPPFVPFAPALAASGVELARLLVVEAGEGMAWAAEQGLRSGACSAVLVWGGRWRMPALRRLQLAAEAGSAVAFLFRGEDAASEHSPAVLRLRVRPTLAGAEVVVLKQRNGRGGARLELSLRDESISGPLQGSEAAGVRTSSL